MRAQSVLESDVSVYGETRGVMHQYSAASSLAAVRQAYDKFFLDTASSTLYWRVIDGSVDTSGTLAWNADTRNPPFTRAGLTIYNQRVRPSSRSAPPAPRTFGPQSAHTPVLPAHIF